MIKVTIITWEVSKNNVLCITTTTIYTKIASFSTPNFKTPEKHVQKSASELSFQSTPHHMSEKCRRFLPLNGVALC